MIVISMWGLLAGMGIFIVYMCRHAKKEHEGIYYNHETLEWTDVPRPDGRPGTIEKLIVTKIEQKKYEDN